MIMMERKNIILWIILLACIIFILIYNNLKEKEEPLIGGCGGVALEHIQECCERWAEENNFVRIQCTGYWRIKGGKCAWNCGMPADERVKCIVKGGKWVEEKIGGELDLNVNSDEECESWRGNCGERIISSFTIGKCDDGSDCWLADIWEPICLMKEI